jgi:hypothetical protein
MNSQIHNKFLKTQNDDGKKHQAYAMEVSRLKKAKTMCEENSDCSEYQRLGGENRLTEIEPLVSKEREINYAKKKVGMDTGRENQFQKEKDPTQVDIAKVTKGSDHSGPSTTNKIMSNDQAIQSRKKDVLTNDQALTEEISIIRYLIEYMNNNNKKQNL